jgi:hypothetical protein
MPSFVENHPRLREAYIKKWNEMVANSFDISEVNKISLFF